MIFSIARLSIIMTKHNKNLYNYDTTHRIITFSIFIFSITTHNTRTCSITIFSKTILSIITHNITTRNIMIYYTTTLH
jgi:hypothetical protein